MIPAAFEYARAESVDHAIELLSSNEDAKILAGGHSLLPLMRLRLARPSMLDRHRPGLGPVRHPCRRRCRGDRCADPSPRRREQRGPAGAVPDRRAHGRGDRGPAGPSHGHDRWLGRPRGSRLRHADGPGGARCRDGGAGAGGASRTVAAGDFFKGLFTPDLAENEVLTEVRVPATKTAGWSYIKFHRRALDWALVGVAAVQSNGGAHVALTNMGVTPLRATGVEEALSRRCRSGRRGRARRRGREPAVGCVRERRVPSRAGEGAGTPQPRGDAGRLATPPRWKRRRPVRRPCRCRSPRG